MTRVYPLLFLVWFSCQIVIKACGTKTYNLHALWSEVEGRGVVILWGVPVLKGKGRSKVLVLALVCLFLLACQLSLGLPNSRTNKTQKDGNELTILKWS